MLTIRDQADRELAERHNLTRGQKARIKREVRAQQYAAVARQGGGARETNRRFVQIGYGAIGYGQLRFQNGLVLES